MIKLAKKYHPDTNKSTNAKEKFVEIQEAYDILSDEQKRAAYDQYGHSAFGGGTDAPGAGGFPGGFQGGFEGDFGFPGFDPSSIFGNIFGGGRTNQRASGGYGMKGEPIATKITISFMEAVKGVVKNIQISPIIVCGTCKGSGAKPGFKAENCKACGGSGNQYFTQGAFHLVATCQVCGGKGKTVPPSGRCSTCSGEKRVRERRNVTVEIPAGIEDDSEIRIKDKGNQPLEGGIPGDLFVHVKVQPSSTFKRQGADVHVDANVPFWMAALGGQVKIPTLDGDVELKVPTGSQPDEVLVMKRKGIKKLHSEDRGNQYVKLKVTLPKKMTTKQRKLLEEYAEEADKDSGGVFKYAFEKVRDYFKNSSSK